MRNIPFCLKFLSSPVEEQSTPKRLSVATVFGKKYSLGSWQTLEFVTVARKSTNLHLKNHLFLFYLQVNYSIV